jgi:hypothetical protein
MIGWLAQAKQAAVPWDSFLRMLIDSDGLSVEDRF